MDQKAIKETQLNETMEAWMFWKKLVDWAWEMFFAANGPMDHPSKSLDDGTLSLNIRFWASEMEKCAKILRSSKLPLKFEITKQKEQYDEITFEAFREKYKNVS